MRIANLLAPDLRRLLREEPNEVIELIRELHFEDVADLVRELSPREVATFLAVVPPREAAGVFGRLDDHEQCDILRELEEAIAVPVIACMASDRRAKLLRIVPEATRASLMAALRALHPVAANEVDLLERWPERSAGRLMTTSFVAIRMAGSVGDALDAVRAHVASSNEPVYAVYALSESGQLTAFARLRELAPLPREQPLSDVWRKEAVTVAPTDSQVDVARVMSKYGLAAVPVVDGDDRLLGLITIDDVVDVLTKEATRAFERAGAVEPLDVPYFRTSFLGFIRKRGPWLIVLFMEEFFTQTALRHYDPVFDAIHGASYYVPLLISTGGNSGSQSATLVIRGLSIREIELRHWPRILLRELGMGFALGAVLGAIGFSRVLMYRDQSVAFALTIGLTLLGIVIVGCTIGAMMPMILRRVGFDPATSSTPFIASLVDVLGIIIFVHVAKLVMADVIARAALAH